MNPLGQMLLAGRYQILEKLGQGGMGEVYKGLDTQTESHVAIKQLRAAISNDETILERFRREGQALSDLNHPNIVKMLDMIQQDNEYFLVTEFLGGGDLANHLRRVGKMPLNAALRMGLELADALSRAHHLGIIHRDIKPANVLLAHDGTPRLTDFGVAHLESQERLTGTGIAIGTMDYLPPEAVNGDAVDVRADVWSFGVMLYEMLTGTRPFEGSTTMQLLQNILTYQPPKIADASPELNQLIQQMLQKDRNQRIRSVRQVGAALEAILHGDSNSLQALQSPSTPIPSPEPMPDLPTTPGSPMKLNNTQESAKRRESSAGQQMRFLGFGFMIALLGIIGVGGGFFLSFAAIFQPEPTITPSPEPTATTAPIVGNAPEGYRWEALDELLFLVPNTWVKVPSSMAETFFAQAEGDKALTALLTILEQQRSWAVYIDWTVFQAVVILIEDTPIPLPDEAHIERAETLAEAGDTLPIEAMEFLDLPLGRTFFMRNDVAALDDAEAGRMEMYSFSRGNTVYTLSFNAGITQFEQGRESFNTILASTRIEGPAEATPEAEALILPNMPEGWKVAEGEYTAFAVPENFLTTTGANQILLNSSLRLMFGSEEAASEVESLFQQMSIDGLAGNLQGTDLFFAATVYQESVLSTDLEAAGTIVEGMFSLIATNEAVDYQVLSTSRVTLPIGEALLTKTEITLPERPAFHNHYYLIVSADGFKLYAIATTFLASEAERMEALTEQIAQTFVILE